MGEDHQDRASHKLVTTEDKIWLPPSYTNNKPPPVSTVPKKRGINWGVADKSFWDWLQLLIIPIILAGATIGFGLWQAHLADLQHQQDQLRAQDQQEATILQTYIDNIQDLLLHDNLLKSKPTDDVAILARARTLTALQGLDSGRKGRLLIFLHEAELIGFDDISGKTHGPIINLSGADLSGADLIGAHLSHADLIGGYFSGGINLYRTTDLSGADLSKAYLIDADLNYAHLSGAHLSHAQLTGADLGHAHLSYADLSHAELNNAHLFQANFSYANLSYANLSHAELDNTYLFHAYLGGANFSHADLGRAYLIDSDLSGANNLTQQQLDQVNSCKNTSHLPPGLTCHHNQ